MRRLCFVPGLARLLGQRQDREGHLCLYTAAETHGSRCTRGVPHFAPVDRVVQFCAVVVSGVPVQCRARLLRIDHTPKHY